MTSVRKLRKKHNLIAQRFIAKISIFGSVRMGKNFANAQEAALGMCRVFTNHFRASRRPIGITERIVRLSFGNLKRQRRANRLRKKLCKILVYKIKGRTNNEIQQTT